MIESFQFSLSKTAQIIAVKMKLYRSDDDWAHFNYMNSFWKPPKRVSSNNGKEPYNFKNSQFDISTLHIADVPCLAVN